MESSLSCEEVSSLLSAYYDNELSKEELLKVENHLSECKKCREKLAEMKNISTIFKKSALQIKYPDGEITRSVVELLNKENICCNEAMKLLSEYYDNELDYKHQYIMEKHLDTCSDCRLELVKLKNLTNLLQASALNKGNELYNHNLIKRIRPNLSRMKDCDFTGENLKTFLKGWLKKHEIIKISEHLLCCKACRRDYEVQKDKLNDDLAEEQKIKQEDIVIPVISIRKRTYLKVAVGILACVLSIGWFSLNSFQNELIKKSQEDTKNKDTMYVYAEDYFIKKSLSIAKEGVLAVLYEKF